MILHTLAEVVAEVFGCALLLHFFHGPVQESLSISPSPHNSSIFYWVRQRLTGSFNNRSEWLRHWLGSQWLPCMGHVIDEPASSPCLGHRWASLCHQNILSFCMVIILHFWDILSSFNLFFGCSPGTRQINHQLIPVVFYIDQIGREGAQSTVSVGKQESLPYSR